MTDRRTDGEVDGVRAGAFLDPGGRNAAAARGWLDRILDRAWSFAASAATRPPLPTGAAEIDYGWLVSEPATDEDLLDKLDVVLHSSANLAHPGYLAHMDPMPTLASLAGDLVTSLLNNNMLFEELSPVCTRLERHLVRAFAQRFGLRSGADGVLVPGGTLANLQSLLVAREATGHGEGRGEARPAIVTSEAAHLSVAKAARALGLGAGAVLRVPVSDGGAMEISRLGPYLDDATKAGLSPFCIVATAGTTVTGSIDPLAEIARVATDRGLWLHVDAAYGGALVFSPSLRERLDGIQSADSITFNPQKWLSVARTSAMALYRDPTALDRAFGWQASADYSGGGERVGMQGLPGTRRTDVLKLWLSLQHVGERGYADLIESSVSRAERLTERLRALPRVELACRPATNLVCFRPLSGAGGIEDDARAEALGRHLRDEFEIVLSLPRWRGRRWLRAVLLNPYIDDETLDRLMTGIEDFYRRDTAGRPPS